MEPMQTSNEKIDLFWKEFLAKTNRSEATKYFDVFHFELTEKLANELLQLVLAGQKRATASSLWSFELQDLRIPEVGDLNIVTDWEGNPKCVIQTTAVTIIPFSEMTYDICKREGEDDSLESWKKGHIRFYQNEGQMLGYEFTESMPVVFEDFEVIYRV
ncbi:MAG TPA: ASCH domain-containing protein [Ureibacillus sp.]|nr:ASCH domain-containing protein [Ureibacillus sp.]